MFWLILGDAIDTMGTHAGAIGDTPAGVGEPGTS
jgi:hypothetical protein